jgi:ribose-phosphate pyrophosphokinase
MTISGSDLVIVGSFSDNPFAIDMASHCGQEDDYADLISLKVFANGEFCPRFISDEEDLREVGNRLEGMTVVLVSTDVSTTFFSRNELVWRTCLVARAAKDNGAKDVVLVEPDLFFSAQDRGPRKEHGHTDAQRSLGDYKKFDGQPFSSLLYSQILKLSGVDAVLTVHNHSLSVQRLFRATFADRFLNCSPAEVFADYILHSDLVPTFRSGKRLLLCAPDKGAHGFAQDIQHLVGEEASGVVLLAKERTGERSVSSIIAPDSPTPREDIAGKDVIIVDDMVRTGGTMRECCRLLKDAGAEKVVFCVSHFHSSREVRENLNHPEVDEIVALNTLPLITNRDEQGRLRKKMTVLKIEKWLSKKLLEFLDRNGQRITGRMYGIDISTKNPRAPKADAS